MKKYMLFIGVLFIVSAGFSYAGTKNEGKCNCKKACPSSCSCNACTCER
jgi:hypothetical protein